MSENDKQDQTDQHVTNNSAQHDAPQSSRRRLLKKSVAIPVIMTLHSGAALARSSNIVSVVDPLEDAHLAQLESNGVISEGYVCARPDATIVQPEEPGRYDLGDNPLIDYVEKLEDCQAPNGILLSSAAYSSLMGIDVPDV